MPKGNSNSHDPEDLVDFTKLVLRYALISCSFSILAFYIIMITRVSAIGAYCAYLFLSLIQAYHVVNFCKRHERKFLIRM